MANLEIIITDKNLSDIIAENPDCSSTMAIYSGDFATEDIIKSIVLSKAKIDKETSAKDFSHKNWVNIANAMTDLSEKNLLIANLNTTNIDTIIEKYKQNNLEIKTFVVDDYEKLQKNSGYKNLELFLSEIGAKVVLCNSK